jgi:phenylalanyl-tRNA synthetase beta chain
LGNVKIIDSPSWIADRISAAGMRPVNLVVDVTNYVMLEIGQPMHAFDYDKIPGGKVVVRTSLPGETIKTLDGSDRVLEAGTLVICDESKPIAVAGVMGGANSEVTAETDTILLETAHFDPGTVRRASKKLGLSTDASYRFERHVDPDLTVIALARAVELLQELTGAVVLSAVVDVYPSPIKPHTISLDPARINKILGTSISNDIAINALTRLGLSVDNSTEPYTVTVPTFRPDLRLPIDLVEEVGRITGYNNLPETIPPRPGTPATDGPEARYGTKVRYALAALGLQEISTFTLAAPSAFDDPANSNNRVAIRHALSAELSGLRQILLPNVLEVLARNVRQKQTKIAIFEVGKVFFHTADGYGEGRKVAAALTGDQGLGQSADYFTVKGIVEQLLAALRFKDFEFKSSVRPHMHPGRTADVFVNGVIAGYVAEVNPQIAKDALDVQAGLGRVAVFELDIELLRSLEPQPGRFKNLPRFPSTSRDIAIVVGLDVPYASITKAIRNSSNTNLLLDVSLQSVYTGERMAADKKSVAVRLVFQAEDRTLTDAEIDAEVALIWTALTEKVAAEQR